MYSHHCAGERRVAVAAEHDPGDDHDEGRQPQGEAQPWPPPPRSTPALPTCAVERRLDGDGRAAGQAQQEQPGSEAAVPNRPDTDSTTAATASTEATTRVAVTG